MADDYFLEDLLSETEGLLDELGGSVNFDLPDEGLERQISSNEHESFKEENFEGQDFRVDGSVDIRVADDGMSAAASFYPPSEGMKPLSYTDVVGELAELGVTFGVKEDIIKDSLFECNTEFKPVKNIIVASGLQAVKHIPQHYVVEQKLLSSGTDNKEKQGRVDYRDISPFKLVNEGQLLAKVVPEQPGEYGMSVKGEELFFSTKSVKVLKPGENTVIYDDHVASACDGTFEMTERGFSVNEVLQIKSDVDYSTGNVAFPGDIILRGRIQDGFTISSGASIYAAGTLDATEVECKKDLFVSLGIIGRKQGKVTVGGRIKAKFIENCYVECQDLIMLENGIMNSKIFTSDKITLGKKGLIVGGCIYAQNGLIATQIGTVMGPRTEIYCGVDFVVENKLKWIRDNSMKVATKLNQVRDQIAKSQSPNPKIIELRDRLQVTLRKLNESSANLVYKLDKNDNADIVVRDTVYPGVYLEICHVSYVVSRQLTSVRFKLDKNEGVIKVEYL